MNQWPGCGCSAGVEFHSLLWMTTLQALPIEVLEWITSTAFADDQVKLYHCGNKVLNTKLMNGGVRRSTLRWNFARPIPSPASWLRLFGSIDNIFIYSSMRRSLFDGLLLDQLPRGLRTLRVHVSDIYLRIRCQQVRLDDLFPPLEVLDLSGSRLGEDMFRHLPLTLVRLSFVDFACKLSSASFFEKLPSTLRSLRLWFKLVDHDPGLKLPPNLETLQLSQVRSNFDFFEKLPASLTSLAIAADADTSVVATQTFDWRKLPRGLKELLVDYPMRLQGDNLLELPSGLESLEAWMDGGVDDGMPAKLPKGLTKWSSPLGSLTPRGLSACPRTLVDFGVSVVANSKDLLSLFPPNVTRIRTSHGPAESKLANKFPPFLQVVVLSWISDEICAALPKSIVSLEFLDGKLTAKGTASIKKKKMRITAAIEVFDSDEALQQLKDADSMIWTTSNDKEAKLRLTERCLANNTLWRLFSIHHRPNNFITSKVFLQSLSLLKDLGNFMINVGTFPTDHLQFLSNKNPSLTALSIAGLTQCPTDVQLDCLPQRLCKLDLEWPSFVTCTWKDEHLAHLPRNLGSLKISSFSPFFTAEGIAKYAPPDLAEFDIAWSQFPLFQAPLDRIYGKKDTDAD